MTRKRSIGEQVLSGFRISGLLLLSFGVFVGLWVGFLIFSARRSQSRRIPFLVQFPLLPSPYFFLPQPVTGSVGSLPLWFLRR